MQELCQNEGFEVKGIAILPGSHLSYVDHIVPLCHMMHIPLLLTDPWIKALIEIYYPPLEIVLTEPEQYNLDDYLEGYDFFLYVDFFRKPEGGFQFHEYHSTLKARSVICLHGNPDKYWDTPWIQQLKSEDIVLAYGPQLIQMLKQSGVDAQVVRCGNYRLEFYKELEQFFDQKLPFKKKDTTLLYAPTWSCAVYSKTHSPYYSPFFETYSWLFDALSPKFHIIVKLHPHMVKLMPDQVEQVLERYPFIDFVHDFPLIYPLLKQTDIYMGDYSSIGYDFLFFDRPLYFLETKVHTPLQDYGKKVKKEELAGCLESANKDNFERKKCYTHVFGEALSLNVLKNAIEQALHEN